MSDQQDPKATKPTKKQGPTGFKMRGQQRVFHHLFRAAVAKFAKNLSWTPGIVKLDMIDHVHHFHTVNSHGMPQRFTTAVGGHFHEVTWEIDEKTGEPVAKCGPALRKVSRNTPRGTKTSNDPLRWKDDENERWVLDDHTHEMHYMGSDELSGDTIQAIQQGNARMVQALEPRPVKGFSEGDRGE